MTHSFCPSPDDFLTTDPSHVDPKVQEDCPGLDQVVVVLVLVLVLVVVVVVVAQTLEWCLDLQLA